MIILRQNRRGRCEEGESVESDGSQLRDEGFGVVLGEISSLLLSLSGVALKNPGIPIN